MLSFRFPCLVSIANYVSKNPTFEIINYHFSKYFVIRFLFLIFVGNLLKNVDVKKNRW